MINFKLENDVATIELNRPDKRNALNVALLKEFKRTLEKFENARVVVLKGSGQVFCAGMDLEEAANIELAQETIGLINDVFRGVYELPCITVALVQGAAIGGGAGLAAACDVVIAEKSAKFGFPEVKRGLVPAQVMSFLMRQIRERDLRELVFLGEMISADRAKEVGLVNRVVLDLDKELKCVLEAASTSAPHAVRETKSLIDRAYPGSFDDDLISGFELHLRMRQSEEAKEGIAAFLEKREPKW